MFCSFYSESKPTPLETPVQTWTARKPNIDHKVTDACHLNNCNVSSACQLSQLNLTLRRREHGYSEFEVRTRHFIFRIPIGAIFKFNQVILQGKIPSLTKKPKWRTSHLIVSQRKMIASPAAYKIMKRTLS